MGTIFFDVADHFRPVRHREGSREVSCSAESLMEDLFIPSRRHDNWNLAPFRLHVRELILLCLSITLIGSLSAKGHLFRRSCASI
jgi:hypothetical protein